MTTLHKMLKAKDLFNPSLVSTYRSISTTPVRDVLQAGRYKRTRDRSFPVTYEMYHPPEGIAVAKSWNSWNTSTVVDGNRTGETAVDDEFIRRFVKGTWHNLFVSEIIIKRHHNIIRVAGIVYQGLLERKMYFLIGYTEELLSYWLQCPVKLELQTVSDRKAVVYKYI